MAISFQCPTCGKKLKAPDNAAGKTSSCPGCGGKVTCPEPVYDAEVVEMTPLESPGVDPYVDLGAEPTYGVVDTEPAQGSAIESRRPCPMCGEMILTTAAKCRFCGEVFDPTIKKGKGRSGKRKELRPVALYQKYLLVCVFGLLTANVTSVFFSSSMRGQPPGGVALAVILLLALASIVAWLGGIVLGAMLANNLYGVGAAILVGILGLIPCLNLITWSVVSSKATNMLKGKGIAVGFLGANLSDF